MTTDEDRSIWADLVRPLPTKLATAKLGIFIHWGPDSVPARAEPNGALGAVSEGEWFRH
jgi:alpha-L-fucosidase